MQTKLFEIRDRATFIGAIGVRISGEDGPLARRSGYGAPCVLLTKLQGGQACYDPYEWTQSRTMTVAHAFIEQSWGKLESGAVVDVEFIRGETAVPKTSEA